MNELALSTVAALAVAAFLLLGVTRELAPAGGLTGRGRWMLMAALGMGVVAFAVKLLAIVAFTLAPQPWTHQHLAVARERIEEQALPLEAALVTKVRWQSLPSVAPAPAENPTTPAKVALGRRLFDDKALSLTRELSCASCHDLLGRAGADGRAVGQGIHGQQGRRNTPTVWNAAFQTRLFWDGRAASLEEQALGPITNPLEMGMPGLDLVIERLSQDEGYRRAFAVAFEAADDSSAVTPARVAAALAAFERTLITPDSPYDRFVSGDAGAMSPLQVRGMALFDAIGCVHCHAGPNFSAASVFDGSAPYRAFPVHEVADLGSLSLASDSGRAPVGSSSGVWRIPSLRNVAVTSPYFHNGAVADLKDAVRIMARTQLGLSISDTPAVTVVDTMTGDSPSVVVQSTGAISESDVNALAAFLEALTSSKFEVHQERIGIRPQ
jgi:cytochrome c peroxidase